MTSLRNYFLNGAILLLVLSGCKSKEEKTVVKDDSPKQPNIVFIYMDDLGYGDLSAYGATELSTPNIDALAEGGVQFTNGYATSATCTPSRYAILTGRYPWRNKDAKILPGTAPLIISTDQLTVPKMLKEKGYTTGIVGKWHLGLGSGNVNWNERVSPGPNEVGFDYSYILAATQDRVPTVYIKDGHVDGLDPNDPIEVSYKENFEGEPTGLENPELTTMKWHHGHNNSIVNGIPRIGYMKGGEAAKWSDVDMADHFLAKAQAYVKDHKDEPFFLYYALQQPHVPRTPHPRFAGKSGMGPRGDVILEADWVVGEFMKTLEEQGLLENTLIVFSSDNGPVVNDGYYDDAVEKLGNHKPSGPLRGGKYSLFDAGTRVPFITYWKGKIAPAKSEALVCQVDLLTSMAALVGSDKKGEDSENFLDVLMGKSDQGRTELVLEAGSRTAFRKGDWAMIPPYKGAAINKQVNIELGNDSEYQLYNLKDDIGQTKNLAKENPEKLQEMIQGFEAIRGKNDVEIKELELK
ncbi:sulfatase family protein [Zobellia galactanivorans]|uniref:Sulfatase, family S1-15 n=1 Tax=Zobellia galactanivorans (strain DSM 12802 / CCUG 47099 / CIP 106680 / NCIMB 13871 / Dsij) TaxID=63186 RepID=G0L7K9_ZOBGA|nr:arylsulfatase [Zobellia galactanivorans]CAZ98132.1 Sulfatase, family S1-15 [Zobellia galactanivorans]